MLSIFAIPAAIVSAFTSIGEYRATLFGIGHFFSLMRSTAVQFIIQNWALSVYFYGLILFAIPLWITDWLGWRRGVEFPDLFETMSWPVRAAVILTLVYGITFFAQRQANEFIYFAF